MKKVFQLFVVIGLIPILGFTQVIENLDYVSPFNEGVSAIKKDNQWAFINNEGTIVIDFRNDLVATKSDTGNYPVFNDNRCRIKKEKDDISYYGYIDKSGKTVIEPQFLNAANYNNNVAIALELKKEEGGKNEVLDKNVFYFRYYEVIIDIDGNIKNYITKKGMNIALDKRFIDKPVKITSKRISDNLIAMKETNGKWTIKTIN